MIHIEIDKASNLEGFKLDVPVGGGVAAPAVVEAPEAPASDESIKKVIRTLIKKHIKITDVEIGDTTSIKDGKITIDGSIVDKARRILFARALHSM